MNFTFLGVWAKITKFAAESKPLYGTTLARMGDLADWRRPQANGQTPAQQSEQRQAAAAVLNRETAEAIAAVVDRVRGDEIRKAQLAAAAEFDRLSPARQRTYSDQIAKRAGIPPAKVKDALLADVARDVGRAFDRRNGIEWDAPGSTLEKRY